MATDPARFPYERRLATLTRAYRDAQRILSARIRAALLEGRDLDRFSVGAHYARQLHTILRLLDDLGYETDPAARQLVQDALSQSAQRTRTAIVGAGVTLPAVEDATFNGVARQAVEALQDSMLGRLTQARQTVGRRVEDVFAAAGRRTALLSVLGADGSRRAASGRLVLELQAQGIRAFTDRAGREWGLGHYVEMVARTTTREAVSAGALSRMAAHGVNLARISTSGNACDVCKPWEGRLVSLDGGTSVYRGEPVATRGAIPNGGPPIHPSCTHVWMPVVTAVDATRDRLGAAA